MFMFVGKSVYMNMPAYIYVSSLRQSQPDLFQWWLVDLLSCGILEISICLHNYSHIDEA
jgi:hypothetical protein